MTIDTTKTLKVWRNNCVDREEDIAVGDLFARFQQSEWATRDDLGYEQQVRMFLAVAEQVSYENDDETTNRLWDLIDLARDAKR